MLVVAARHKPFGTVSTSQTSAGGLTINIIYDQVASALPAGFMDAVDYVVNYFGSLFTSNITINIDLGYGGNSGRTARWLARWLHSLGGRLFSARTTTVSKTLWLPRMHLVLRPFRRPLHFRGRSA